MFYSLQAMRALEVHKVLLESGGGGLTVGQVARKMKMARSYVWMLLQRLESENQIDRVEVIKHGKAQIVYYTRMTEGEYISQVNQFVEKVF